MITYCDKPLSRYEMILIEIHRRLSADEKREKSIFFEDKTILK